MRAAAGCWIEKQTLDCDEPFAPEYANQQGWEKAHSAASAHRAAGVKPNIRRDKPDPTHIAEIPLSERAFDRLRLSPKTAERGFTIVGCIWQCTLIRDSVSKNLPYAAHYDVAVAASKAMNQDGASPLPDRQARRSILVRRTMHHGMMA